MPTLAQGSPSYDASSSYPQPRIQGPIITTWILAIIASVLRFFARRMSKAGLWYDDWLIFPALLAASALSYVVAGWMINNGLGKPIIILEADAIPLFLEGLYIAHICWTIGIFFLKCSILALYWRMFHTVKHARMAIWVLLGETFCWGLAAILITTLACRPIRGYWIANVGSNCIDQITIAVGSSIPHVITDGILLLMPILLLWKSQMQWSRKLTLCAIFGVGGFVTVVSILRLVTLRMLSLVDLTTDIANTAIWTCVEVNTSLTCACLPSMRPIWSFIADKWTQYRNRESQHLRGKDLIEDMLPRRQRSRSTPILAGAPTLSLPSIDYEEGQIPPLLETEANERLIPECDAIGTAICEVGSEEIAASELENWRAQARTKLGGMPHVVELQAKEIAAAELDDSPV